MFIAKPARSARRGRLRLLDSLTLVAVGVVVFVVSLPRLREFKLSDNESDARRLVARLGEMLSNPVHASDAHNVETLVHGSKDLTRQLEDAEFLEQGRLLRRHGYLFELAPAGSDAAAACVRAWPWQYQQTGVSVFAWTAGAGLRGHDNEGGRWSGPEQPPPSAPIDAAGWKAIAAR